MGATLAGLGVNSFAVGFKENSLALGFNVDFLTLSGAGDTGDAPVSGAGGDKSGAAGAAVSGCGDGSGVEF